MNPLNSTASAESDVYSYLVDSLYHTDYDWAKAIANGKAAYPGDFSQVRDRHTPENPEDGLIGMPYLERIYLLGMASVPYGVNLGTDFDKGSGELDAAASKEGYDNEWIIKLRKDLSSLMVLQLLLILSNIHLNNILMVNKTMNVLTIYTMVTISTSKGEEYFKQGRPIDANDPSKGVHPAVDWEEVDSRKLMTTHSKSF